MNRDEILAQAKPILFNTEMVREILKGRKTVTRRVIKLKYSNTHHEIFTNKYGTRLIEIQNDVEGETFGKNEYGTSWRKLRGYVEPKPPYKKGDFLYVREAWEEWTGGYLYRAWPDGIHQPGAWMGMSWRPSIHMPKAAARIFLKVTDVRVERLRDITWQQAADQGCYGSTSDEPDPLFHLPTLRGEFSKLWDSTVKKKDMDKYGWNANPWVWVIEFEKVEVE